MIRITESTLHNIIAEAINKILKEDVDGEITYTFGCDTKHGIKQSNGFVVYPWWINFHPDKKTVLLAQSKLATIPNHGPKDKITWYNIDVNTNKVGCKILSPIFNLFDKDGNIKNTLDVKRSRYVYELIKAVSKLNIDDFEDILTSLYLQVKNTITEKAQKIANESEDDLWVNICNSLGKENVKDLMKKLRISFAKSSIIGHQFSYGNRLKALGQALKYGKTITFLATAKDWKYMYNRKVNFNAMPYYLRVPRTSGATYKEADDYAKSHGYPDGLKGLSVSQKKEIFIKANNEVQNKFSWAVFYDIADTVLISNRDDKWNNSIGYEDNLSGIPNKFTNDKLAKKDDNDSNELGKMLYGNNDYSEPKKVYLSARTVAIKYGIKPITPNGNNDTDYEKALYETLIEISKKIIPDKARVKKPENVAPLANALSILILIACHINPEAFMYDRIEIDPDDIKGLKPLFTSLIREILNNMNESKTHVIYEVLNNIDKWFDEHYKLILK